MQVSNLKKEKAYCFLPFLHKCDRDTLIDRLKIEILTLQVQDLIATSNQSMHRNVRFNCLVHVTMTIIRQFLL